ncbi:helix-turn-helix domain-containing protein [Actinomadura barringtoniae]|uniref:Helix-turn-helix domain-containing protein n=1 Tax=Actinomadura barringtoniae TaxID=1427535 RepID=A0A939T8W9_9ACTN|nr:helix-turn-helix transcriptional regulator [Actinomadura barringtoniae]MBO2450772.1 helix-turn-helix domain-containing protein [Actinomadura barringtoniae]
MPTDQGPVVQRALLVRELNTLRRETGLRQEEVASAQGWSTSKLIRIEGGKTGISKNDLLGLLRQYGVDDPTETDRLVELARGAGQRGWWDDYKADLRDPAYFALLGYETGASFIRHYQGQVVPGLLQTKEYAEMTTEEYLPPAEVGTIVNVRMRRQRELRQRDPQPYQFFILDEAVIRRRVGVTRDASIMPSQLDHLVSVAQRDNVTIEVIPFSKGAHIGMRGPFELLEFEGGLDDVAFLESGRRADKLLLGGDDRIPDLRAAFETLRRETLNADETIDFIRTVREEMT